LNRRAFLLAASAAPLFGRARMKPVERMNLALKGGTPDRAPFSFWHHFGLQSKPPEFHAKATLHFQLIYRMDLVKVMSDFPYPKSASANWWELKAIDNPFPAQIEALKLISNGVQGQKYFVETIFNPYSVAEKLSSKEEVKRMMAERPQQLLDALEAIAKSEASHAKLALDTGAKGIFLAIANAQDSVMTREQYDKFSAPFDKIVLDAAAGAPLNTLHLYGKGVWLDRFWRGWGDPIINYSISETGVPLAEARRHYSGVLMGGLDETKVRTAHLADYQKMIQAASAAGPKWFCTPGCEVPANTSDARLFLITRAAAAGT
jgi:uroporphyrinogen-III decarboxylase